MRRRRVWRRALRTMANAPKERLDARELEQAWAALAESPALPALRQWLDGLVSERSDDVTDERLWLHPALAAAAAARYDLAVRIRSDLEDMLAVAAKGEKEAAG